MQSLAKYNNFVMRNIEKTWIFHAREAYSNLYDNNFYTALCPRNNKNCVSKSIGI